MDEKMHLQNDTPVPKADDHEDRNLRRTYEKPRVELHDVSRAILGNESPATADGLSGTFRT